MTKVRFIVLLAVTFTSMLFYPSIMLAEGKPKEFPVQATDIDLEKNDAQWQCEQFITKTLDDPYKAKFDYFGMFPAKKNTDSSYQVTAIWQVDEKSPKKQSQCILKKTGQDEWQLVGIKELP